MFTRREDVIYGRKYGTALTMDVFTPDASANGLAVVAVISGGWASSHSAIETYIPILVEPLVRRGYTAFAAVPGSQPRFTIDEIAQDVHRAVRYIRYHAADFNIDPHHIGICGSSAGGHLSLLIGLTGDVGDPMSEDTVEQASSRVQAVAEFCGPTDFFNYGQAGENAVASGVLAYYRAPFDFHRYDPEVNAFLPVGDDERLEIARQISPITHVHSGAPPTLAVHGEIDLLVPLQQSQILIDALHRVGVPAQLVVKPGAAHGWDDMGKDADLFADWFDTHLSGSIPTPAELQL